ncbi:MAG: hypothetical protein KGH75_03160 [Rhodospirillales bacterium]|nr:hypothetical protein [Rhodospirillales bacterium]
MLELSLTKILLSQELPLLSTSPAFDEGTGLEFIMGTNQANTGSPTGAGNVVQPGSGNSGAYYAGAALNVYTRPSTGVWVDTLTVSATTYTVTLTQIPTAANTISVVAGGVQYTQVSSNPTSTQFTVGGTNNQTLTFNSAAAGTIVTVTYTYSLSIQQAEIFVGDGVAGGYSPSSVTNTVGVIERGIFYTSDFTTATYWGAGNVTNITLAAGGLYTTGGSGASVPGTVYQIPTTDIPFLGLYVR